MDKITVGKIRQQTALCGADMEVVLILKTKDGALEKAINIELTECYPDTTDVEGNWKSTFKIVATIK